jgi:(1->4)-alpha-D-glucan 1-alpha-D-glucosylmutase
LSEFMDLNKLAPEKWETIKKVFSTPRRFPVSVYRLQFNSAFTFKDAAGLVAYLNQLGVTDCYASPYYKARPGSSHGYDVADQNILNPEIGANEDFLDLVNQLQKYKMGQIIDFVPNHMSIFDNPKWQDVLENGPGSIYARYFDIDWNPVKVELSQKVLLPILEDMYGTVLERGQIFLGIDNGSFFTEYRNHRLPVGPKTIVPILESSLNRLLPAITDSNPGFLELQSVVTACKNLPERSETDPTRMVERHREKEIIKKRLAELTRVNEPIRSAIDDAIKAINGTVGDSQSFTGLHDLLTKQVYRLAFWRVASEEINYRRFFDINELVALRMEDPEVFEETHRLVRDMFGKGLISGIRIDHVDGLFDPADYLVHLQKDLWLEAVAQNLKKEPEFSSIDLKILKQYLIDQTNREPKAKNRAAFRPVYIAVEKILGENENLNKEWPVEGTTGYEFATALNQIFIDQKRSRSLLNIYRKFTGNENPFDDIAYNCKNLVMRTTMSGEVNMLAHRLNRISEKSWQYRDFTLNSLSDAIREVIACFPVYRTYIKAYSGYVSEKDGAVVKIAIETAKMRNPAVNAAIFDFVRDTLLLQYPTGMDDSGRDEQRLFVMRFQQFTGPVMAKGVEDTAFYIYNPLISLNDVGGNPLRLGTPVQEFHNQNIARLRNNPRCLISTSTHDSKRGEDVRARINVLSEIPGIWKSAVTRWRRLNKSKKIRLDGESVPDMNEEYLLYQTLIGSYLANPSNARDLAAYRDRIQNYMLKAIKEAKVHTSWINPNTQYEEGLTRFLEAIMDTSEDNLFWEDFQPVCRLVASCGIYNSLSQVVLKIFSPGVPDIYQGNELWAFNLTDPDNRNPVDYKKRTKLLARLAEQESNQGFINDLIDESQDGRLKLYATWKSLIYRKDNPKVFQRSYQPLKAAGPKKNHLCVFAWIKGDTSLIVAVPRLIGSLTRQGTLKPLGEEAWASTRIVLPGKIRSKIFRNIFTGKPVLPIATGDHSALSAAEVFGSFPVAVLESN